jgi:hypothetical protein
VGFDRRAVRPTPTIQSSDIWPREDADLLSELASRLGSHVEELSAECAQRLVLHLEPSLRRDAHALEALAWVNTWYLDDHLARLTERRVDSVVREYFERHLRLLRSQRNSPPELRLTLPQLYMSLEISASLFAERAQLLFAGDPRLPSVLAAIGRLSLHLGQSVSQAFHAGPLRGHRRGTADFLGPAGDLGRAQHAFGFRRQRRRISPI